MTKKTELKFTPENLERHKKALDVDMPVCRSIYTTRSAVKGRAFEVVKVEGIGHFILLNTFEYPPGARYILVRNMWEKEGFSSPEEFSAELDRLYPEPQTLYVHHYIEVFLDD